MLSRTVLVGSLTAVAMLLALVGAGCRPASIEDGHVHGEEPVTAQITVWTDQYEVFAEHQAPVAGTATTFITHITDLRTLEPRRTGMVKFVLQQGEVTVEHPQAAPARAGIYLPAIRFPGAGDWRVTLLVPADGTTESVDLGTVKVHASADSAAHAAFPAAPDGLSFLKEQQWKILARSEPITKRPLVERLRVAARVRPKPGFRATVTAPMSGQLGSSPGQPAPRPGQAVEAEQLLAVLKPSFSEPAAKLAEAESEFNTAGAALEQAKSAYDRTKMLAAQQAKSARELEEVDLAYQSARGRYTAAAGLLATFKQTGGASPPDSPLIVELRAPISGVIGSVAAGPGEMVSANQPLFTVLNPETVWVEAQIPEGNLHLLSATRNAAIEWPGARGQFMAITGNGRGHVVSLGLEVNAVTRTVPLIFETANSDAKLLIGQQLALHVETAHVEEALAIPESALVEEGDVVVAFVHVSGETFEKRELTLGIRDTGYVQVLSGIQEGERVVTRGAYAIRLSSISGVIPAHGHAH